MLNPKDISNYNNLSKSEKQALEKDMQHDDLSYLSSLAFEQFKVSDSEITKLNSLIDKKTGSRNSSFNTIFISLLCGLLIGISIFFVIFQKSKNHPSVYQSIEEEEQAAKKLNNNITETDTVFPIIEHKVVEHYNTIAEKIEEEPVAEMPEMLPSKSVSLPVIEDKEEDIVFAFTPNAPVVFISNLKVTNYRMYYFKQSEAIDLSINTGVSAQYGSKADIERPVMNSSNTYLAHKVIAQAMRLFNSKHITNCIEELAILYKYNKDDANAQFYLGMCYYQLNKYGIAETYFQKNLDNVNNIFHQESEFYQALCLLNLKQTDEALKQLQTIVNNKGFYSERAKETIHKFNK
ncbi:MAG: CDC27 family protein [Bacteroidetes bacterium]|nr:CDC27 family protein [Bacteroidota bacterium]